jgi:hypothetical protein
VLRGGLDLIGDERAHAVAYRHDLFGQGEIDAPEPNG